MKTLVAYVVTGIGLYAMLWFASEQVPAGGSDRNAECSCAGQSNCSAVILPVDQDERAFCAFADVGDCCLVLKDSGVQQ